MKERLKNAAQKTDPRLKVQECGKKFDFCIEEGRTVVTFHPHKINNQTLQELFLRLKDLDRIISVSSCPGLLKV